ncbi:MAG: S1C family serine protease [Bacteroidota bacterium]|nr:S1C family serine protease [Bacteroidota bacterium]MDP4231591.1 S1C family serine protease [Bacteroidota bacterium]MDP4236497.1 S1C family serine protease [Bacteroidota bacterium]
MSNLSFRNILSILLCTIFFLASCRSNDSVKPVEGKSLRDSLKFLSDSLSKYKTASVQPGAGAKNVMPLKQLYKKLKSAVFLIYTVDNTDTAQGSGFFVDSSGIAISNYHVFESAGKAVAVTDDDKKYPISQILGYSEEKDYVIFRVGGGDQSFPYVKKCDSAVEIGDDCFAVGNPKGLTQTLSTGIVSGLRFDGKVIQTTTAITFGSSGGALFNSDGQVIGITSGGMGEGNLNFAININEIPFEHFLKRDSAVVPPLPKDIQAEIRENLEGYFKALFDKDYDKLEDYFTDNLFRFYSKFNISDADAVKSLREDAEKSQIESGKVKIHWKTLKIERSLWGYEAKFNAEYFLVRTEKTKPSHFNLDIVVEFNKDLLIQSMYENILSKKNS